MYTVLYFSLFDAFGHSRYPPPAFMYFDVSVVDGTFIPFSFFYKRYVRGLHLILLFSCACLLADVRIIKVGHEPLFRQEVGRVLLLPEQVVVVQIYCDGIEPFLVCQEE